MHCFLARLYIMAIVNVEGTGFINETTTCIVLATSPNFLHNNNKWTENFKNETIE